MASKMNFKSQMADILAEEEILEKLYACKPLSEQEVKMLCVKAKEILSKE